MWKLQPIQWILEKLNCEITTEKTVKIGSYIDIACFTVFLCGTIIFILVLNSQMVNQYPLRAENIVEI